MKALKIFGLAIFLIGFFLFNATTFWASFKLTAEVLQEKIADKQKLDLFTTHASPIIGKTFTSNHAFVSALNNVFDRANREQLKKYNITDAEIEQIIERSNNKFTTPILDSVFRASNEVAAYKNKAFREYSITLEGTAFRSRDEYQQQLQEVADKIEKYGVINKVGFDRYAIKDLRYSLAKASAHGPVKNNSSLFLLLTFGLCIIGALLYILPKLEHQPGIKNNRILFNPMKNTGWLGILTGTWLIVFYLLLYFYPEYMTNWVIMVDPVSQWINGHEAGKFFLYGFIYTLCILVMGVRFIIHYRHSKYQILRTVSVMFFQTAFAFLIPEILIRLNKPYYDFKNIWPLDYSFFFDYRLSEMAEHGTLGIFMLGWGIALTVVGVPVMVYFFGKRWYCSWVCGCGGLAETLGDPYRHLSQKSLKAWKIERWMVHGVLVFAVVMTIGVLYTWFTGSSHLLFIDTYTMREIYGVGIGAAFAGVVGTGFYPLMGNRVWCRYGCPLAAYIGLVQRFKSRFRITTNGGQCISCGNCSTYCEMGIDVRWYAQRGQNIVRASCVGCGICSAVCPRGVLNLEVKDEKGRFGEPVLIGNNHIKLKD
ncbi:MAG: 4Fe-4S dicluster domain-containing protein [Cyclobacteriaceae bacterium]